MVRDAAKAETFAIQLKDVFSIQFQKRFLILGSSAQASHTPAPLERGALKCCFLFVNEG